jgi:hypothetical protein
MSESPPSDEENTWHRRLASRANNRAWTLAEQQSRTPHEDREMLDAAHASMHLWSSIGTARNVASAELLLGQVHALLANPPHALHYAQAAHAYFTSNPNEPAQVAFSHAVLAAAAHCAGDAALHETHYRAAVALLDEIPNKEAKANLEATLNVIPKPGVPRS